MGLCIGLTVLFFLIDVGAAWSALLGADPWWLLAAAALAINVTFIVAVKLWAVVRIVDLRRTVWQTWSAVMAGLALNVILPARGGDLARAVFLSDEEDSIALLLGAVLVERLVDVSAIAAVVLVAGFGWNATTGLSAALIVAALAAGVALAWLGPRSPIRPDLGERVSRTASQVARRPGWAGLVAGLSLMAWTNNAALFVCCLKAVGVSVGWVEGMRASAVSILAGIVPISISGIGTRDAVLVLWLEHTGQADAVAAAGLLFTVVAYWFLALFGALVLGPETLRTIRTRLKSRGSRGPKTAEE
ncbi:MAG: lysylphosphatidylglycerol synthase transmembrane domain-containing protein [Myxococcota bacterium]